MSDQPTGDEAAMDLTISDIRDSPDKPLPDDYDDGRDPAYGPDYDDPALHQGADDDQPSDPD